MEIEVPQGWMPRQSQMPAWCYLEQGGKRADLCWHRRCGKDLFALSWTARATMQRVGVYWHMLPQYGQARKAIWEGRTNDGKPFLDVFPEQIIKRKKENEMMMELINGSIWQLQGADEPDRLVGTNPVGVIFSEWSLMSAIIYTQIIQPILAANGGWAIFIYTPRGQNHAYEQRCRMEKHPDWFVQKLTIDDTRDESGKPIISKEYIEYLKNEENVSEALINQEYYCSFDAPMEGAYYAKELKNAEAEGRITTVPWEPSLSVHTAWDLGVGDATTIWFFQLYGHEVRVIDYYENSGEGLPHYAKILKEKPYVYGTHDAPHDIAVRELSSGKSRLDTARKLGIRFRVGTKHALEDGIEAVRGMFPRCWFDKTKCERGLRGLREYRKEFNEAMQCYSSTPRHDWASHPADSFRYLAACLREANHFKKERPRKAITEYDIYRN